MLSVSSHQMNQGPSDPTSCSLSSLQDPRCGSHSYSTSPSTKSLDNAGVCQSAGVPTLPPRFFSFALTDILLIRVSRDGSQAADRCLYALARRRTALRAGKQTVTDRWGRRSGEELAAGAAAVRRREDSNWHLGTRRRADVAFLPANNNVSLIRSGPPGPLLSQEGGEGGPTSLGTRRMGSAGS